MSKVAIVTGNGDEKAVAFPLDVTDLPDIAQRTAIKIELVRDAGTFIRANVRPVRGLSIWTLLWNAGRLSPPRTGG